MANNYELLPLNDACVDYGCAVIEVCLPPFEDCDGTPTDSLLVECDQKWNCNLCETDEEYFIPFIKGEKIQIQTMFTDLTSPNRESPTDTSWITVGLYGPNGLLTDDTALFLSRKLFGWNGTNNYQIWEIDTALIPGTCFSIQFDTSNGRSLCSEDFRSEPTTCPEETILIRGLHEKFDCNGFYYGEPVGFAGDLILFDNTLRFHAGMQAIPGTIKKKLFGTKTISAEIQEIWKVVLTRPIPPYIDRLLLKTYFAAPATRITTLNGNVRDLIITSFRARDKIDYSNMMLYTADLFISCTEAVKRC